MASYLAGSLEAWFEQRGEASSVEVRDRATVGLSQDTWFVCVHMVDKSVEAVLRLPTPSSGGRAIRSQRAALQAVAGRVPAPSILWHEDTEDNPLGRPFIVMDRMYGEIPVQWCALSEPVRTRLAQDAMDVLATLHTLDPTLLQAVGPEVPVPNGELDFYRRRLARLGELPAVLELALRWLERHEPPPPRRTLVHGDYRMGNLVVQRDSIVGVLDWEMVTIGDPLADLAWCFIPVWGLPGIDEAALVGRYAEHFDVPLDEERLHWQRVLGYVRLAYYALSGMRAFDESRSQDLRLAALALQLPVHLDRLAATLAGEPVH